MLTFANFFAICAFTIGAIFGWSRDWIVRVCSVIALLSLCIGVSGCAVLPPSIDDVASSCNGKVASVQTTDSLSFGLLFGLVKFSTQPTRHAECGE